MKNLLNSFARAALCCIVLNSMSFTTALAQGTGFTYQGRLSTGTNVANGSYDIQFSLYAVSSGGSPVQGPVTKVGVGVSNGLFTTMVDFGNVFTAASNWLQISVSTNGANSFSPLLPRQQLTPSPYALFAGSANASNLVGIIPAGNLSGVALLAGGNALTGNQTITSGSVGIGTPTPAKQFDVTGTASAVGAGASIDPSVFVRVNNSSSDGNSTNSNAAGIGFGRNSTRQAIVGGTFGVDYLDLYTGGLLTSPRMRVDVNGNVGIGTTSPGARLDVNGGGLFNGGVGIKFNNTLQFGAGITGQEINAGKIGYETFTSDALDIVGAGTNDTIRKLKFWAEGGANFAGNVGIRTGNPFRPLQVGSSTSPIDALINLACGNGLANRAWEIGVPYGTNNSAGEYYSFVIRDTGSGGGDRMVLRWDNGFVGIGVTNPETALQLGNYSSPDTYLTVSTAGGNLYRSGIDLRHFNSGYGWTLVSDERDNSFRLLSHFNDTDGISRIVVERGNGYVGIGVTNPGAMLDVAGEINSTAINITSDRNAKEDLQTINPQEILAKVSALPITEWQYKADKANHVSSRHIGPMAQDFTAAFALGNDDKHISVVDEGGVALAAIQALNEKVGERDARIQAQEIQIQNQAAEIHELSRALTELQAAVGQMQREVAKSNAD